jgi:hypothetical protein
LITVNRGPRPASTGRVARAPRPKAGLTLLTCSTALFLALLRPVAADDVGAEPRNNFGGVGLIDMPSARMAPDGELAVGASFLRHNQHYNVTFQALPWLETDFRYSGLEHFDASFPVYYDRSFAMKARLWDETDIYPAVALGIDDLVGTGIYGGEYLVASKRFGPFDTTLGIGWGRLGSTDLFKNPLIHAAASFANRSSGLSTPGGASFSAFFHGPYSGLFGGVVWHTPLDKLSLLLEYSSDTYQPERISGDLTPRGQVNIGASYKLLDNATLGLSWLYGTTLNGSIAFALDPTTDAYPQHINDPPMPPPHLRTQAEQQLALNSLLQRREGAASPNTILYSSSGLNALSDALFAETGDLNDVSTRGKSLMLGVGKDDVQSICVNAAAMVARYNVDVETVLTTNAAGKSARCAVRRLGSGTLVNAMLMQNPGATSVSGLAMAPASFLTIDASAPASVDPQTAIQTIKADAAKQKIVIQAISLTDDEAIVYYSDVRYLHEDDAVRRLVHVLLADAPTTIEKFRMLPTAGGVALAEFDVLRGPTERDIAQTGQYSLLDNGNILTDAPLQNPVLSASARGTYPRFSWDLFPQFRQELFDPQNPFAVQFVAGVQGIAEVRPGLTAIGEVEASIYDNFNTHRDAGSVLPHVRTDWTRFFTEGKDGIGQLELDYLTRLAPDVFAQARIGYLESMFAGVGGEVLWRPEGQRWAIGGDLYDVEQRAFNRQLGLQPYKAVTGHVTLYYASPWYGVNFAIRAGQYLAGDRGLTVEITRRFSTGVEMGAFFTKTNVSAQQFGEGSFDKGFIIRIPLQWTMPVSTQSVLSTIIRPVQRDGGQALDGDANLYGYLQRNGTADVLAHAEDFAGGEE